MNRRSELVAMRAAGISAWRFILPFAAAAFLTGVVTVVAINPLASMLNGRFELERGRLMENYLGDQPKDIWLRQGDEHSQIVIHAHGRDTRTGVVRLHDVTLFVYEKTADGRPQFKPQARSRRSDADAGLLAAQGRARGRRGPKLGAFRQRCRSDPPSTPRPPCSGSPRPTPSPSGACLRRSS
jgi:hypothetical protein